MPATSNTKTMAGNLNYLKSSPVSLQMERPHGKQAGEVVVVFAHDGEVVVAVAAAAADDGQATLVDVDL